MRQLWGPETKTMVLRRVEGRRGFSNENWLRYVQELDSVANNVIATRPNLLARSCTL